MSNTHEALRHADLLSKEFWPADMTLPRWADKSANTIRTQHALIVQMAEALSDLNLNVGEAMATGGWVPTPLHTSFWEASANAIGAHATATQYLEQK